MRIGHGYDVHRLVPGRKLILGGVEIPYALGLDGHSDADVLQIIKYCAECPLEFAAAYRYNNSRTHA